MYQRNSTSKGSSVHFFEKSDVIAYRSLDLFCKLPKIWINSLEFLHKEKVNNKRIILMTTSLYKKKTSELKIYRINDERRFSGFHVRSSTKKK